MISPVTALGERVVGTVEEVHPDRIKVLVGSEAPRATALNTGAPIAFPRINGHLLIPHEGGATACVISSVRIRRSTSPTPSDLRKTRDLVTLPTSAREISAIPIGTLRAETGGDGLSLKVQRGVDIFPAVGDPVLVPTQAELAALVEGETNTIPRVLIGHCPTAGYAPVHVDPDKLFGRHLAILGNTGAGKSCSVAGLVRWCLEAAELRRSDQPTSGAPNARFIILDPNGEYASAFKDRSVRVFKLDPAGEESRLQVPAWLWNGEEWAVFSSAAPGVQRPVLYDAIRHLRSGLGSPDMLLNQVRLTVRGHRKRLQGALLGSEHQAPGKREGVATALLNVVEDSDNLAEKCEGPRPDLNSALRALGEEARGCEARFRSKPSSQQWHNDFSDSAIRAVIQKAEEVLKLLEVRKEEPLLDQDVPRRFSVERVADFVDALATARRGGDITQFVDTLRLRIQGLLAPGRLSSILNPRDADKLELDEWLAEYIGEDQAANGAVAVIDLSLVPSEAVHLVVAVLGRMILEALQRHRRMNGKELPTALVLDEAHTFVHRDLRADTATPAGRACGRAIERIAREGRKFGLGLVLASQRPSELSPTVLSQCNTFLLHRLVNENDQEFVRRLVPDALGPLLREISSLGTRRAILLGWAAPSPTLVEIRELSEAERPHSPDPPFWKVWTGQEAREIDWRKIADHWQNADSGHD